MDKEKLSASADQLRLTTIGLNFVLCTFAGLGLGWLAQKYLHLGSWAIMAGFFFGVIVSYVNLYKEMKSVGPGPKKPPVP